MNSIRANDGNLSDIRTSEHQGHQNIRVGVCSWKMKQETFHYNGAMYQLCVYSKRTKQVTCCNVIHTLILDVYYISSCAFIYIMAMLKPEGLKTKGYRSFTERMIFRWKLILFRYDIPEYIQYTKSKYRTRIVKQIKAHSNR